MFGLTRTIIIINVTPVSPVTAAHTDLLSHPCSWLYDEVNDPNSAVQKTFCFADYHAWEKTIDYRNRSPISSTSISSDRLLRRIFFSSPPRWYSRVTPDWDWGEFDWSLCIISPIYGSIPTSIPKLHLRQVLISVNMYNEPIRQCWIVSLFFLLQEDLIENRTHSNVQSVTSALADTHSSGTI